jgi:hypothetical protein
LARQNHPCPADGCGTAEIHAAIRQSQAGGMGWQAFMAQSAAGLTREKTRKPGKPQQALEAVH